MYFPKEIWKLIKLQLFHNINYGKHKKNNKYIQRFNTIMTDIPRKVRENIYGNYSLRLRYDFYYFEKFYVHINDLRNKPIEIYEHQML